MSTIIADRALPSNIEAERSVIGAILLDNGAINVTASTIGARDFFRDAHRRIFDKMVKLVERGDAIDLVTLKEELGCSGDLEEVGGPAYIASLVDGVPRSMNVEHYARIVKEKARLRDIIFAGNKLISAAYEATDAASAIIDDHVQSVLSLAEASGEEAVRIGDEAIGYVLSLDHPDHSGEMAT